MTRGAHAVTVLRRSRLRRATAMLALLGALSTACGIVGDDEPAPGQVVEFVAGGGERDAGRAADARIEGRLIDFTVGPDGTVYVLTDVQGGVLTLWSTKSGGALNRVQIPALGAGSVSQLAVGRSGAVYLASWQRQPGVWQVRPDGKVSRVVGDGTGTGPSSSDGTPAGQVKVKAVDGVAVAANGGIYFAERLTRPTTHVLVRAVADGKVRTILGRNITGVADQDWTNARTSTGFPASAPATAVVLDGSLTRIAVGGDGTVYAASTVYGLTARKPDGTAAAVFAGGPADSLTAAKAPFATIGTSRDGRPRLMTDDHSASLAVDGASSDLYVVAVLKSGQAPATFTWTGDFTAGQKSLIEARVSAPLTTAVLRVAPDGTVATAAYGASAVAVHGDWLYLAAKTRAGSKERVIVVRAEIPR